MLSFVRKAARSWVAAVLIGLLVISFAIWGINDVFQGGDKNNVAMVAGKPITAFEYRSEFDRILKRATKESGRQITAKEAREQGADVSTLERMVSENALLAFMKKIGINIAGTILKSEIGKIEAFKDPLTKNFSQSTYEQTLAENGLTPATFEPNIAADMGKRLLVLAGTSGFRAPNIYASQTLAYGTERRLVTMIPVAAKLAGSPPTPNDAQLKAFYDLNSSKLMRPETRDLTIVIASLDSFAAKASVNPAQVKEIFEAQKAKLAQPAKRSFVQIIAKDEASANEVAKRLKAGENAEEIAKALKLQAPLNFTDATPNQVPDSAVSKAVFAATTGAIGSVKGALSFSAFQITGAKAEIAADFAKIAPEITKQLQKEAAGQALTDATGVFDEAIAQGDNVLNAAKKAGFATQSITNITKEGVDTKTGQPIELLAKNPEFLARVFELGQGESTDLLNAPNDSYIAFSADKIVAASPVPLQEVKGELTSAWVRQELNKRLKAKADEILKDAKASGLEAAAKKHNLSIVKPPIPLLRGQGSQELSLAIFSGKKGDIVSGAVANGVEFAIVRIDSVLRDDDAKAKDRLLKAEESVRTTIQQDIAAALEDAARKHAKVKIFNDRMKRALGDNEEDIAPAKKK